MDVPANFPVTSDMWWKLCCGFPFGFVFLKLLLPLMNMESCLHVDTLGFSVLLNCVCFVFFLFVCVCKFVTGLGLV